MQSNSGTRLEVWSQLLEETVRCRCLFLARAAFYLRPERNDSAGKAYYLVARQLITGIAAGDTGARDGACWIEAGVMNGMTSWVFAQE